MVILESPGSGKKYRHVVTDAKGRVEISIPSGGTVYVEAVEPGLFGRFAVLGKGGLKTAGAVEMKLWLGTKVTG